MKRLPLILTFCLLWIGTAFAQGGMGPGPGTVHSAGGGGYTGPGDIVSGASAWYGARAYSTATRGNKAMNVCNVADAVCADFSTDATTGDLVISTIGGSSCSSVTCTVKTWYDQSGNGNDITQATIASRPTLLVSCVSSKPCLVFAGAQEISGTVSSQAFQYMENVSIVTGNFSANLTFMYGTPNQFPGMGSGNGAANRNFTYSNAAVVNGTATNSVWHITQGVYASTGIISVDNVETSGSSFASGNITAFEVGGVSSSAFLTGDMVETGVWNSTPSSGNRTSMSANARSYWGF